MGTSSVEPVTGTDHRLTVPEVARRLGVPGMQVYQLIFQGHLDGRPAADGAVYVSAASLESYLQRAVSEGQKG
jgi:hypothetical protein